MNNEKKQETSKDIVAEMRDATMNGEYDDATVDAWADRIEAAWMRERESGAEAAQICGEIGEAIGRGSSGNAAKMREALYAITLIDTRMLKRLLCELVEADIFDGGQIRNTIHAVEKARQAIAAPPRNCDLYRTKKELDAAYEKYREYVIMSNSNPFVAKDEMMTKEDWLFAEEKGEAK